MGAGEEGHRDGPTRPPTTTGGENVLSPPRLLPPPRRWKRSGALFHGLEPRLEGRLLSATSLRRRADRLEEALDPDPPSQRLRRTPPGVLVGRAR